MSLNTYSIAVDSLTYQLRHVERSSATDTHSISNSPAINLLGVNIADTPVISQNNSRLELTAAHEIKNQYPVNYWVFVDNEKLGYVSMQHIRAVVDKELISFTLSNPALYSNYVEKMSTFFADFQLQPVNVTRFDIAIDTHVNLVELFLEYFTKPDEYHYLYRATNGYDLGISIAGTQHRNGKQSLTLTPQISADKRFRIYSKTKEIAKSGKNYITDYHEANGLDIKQEIHRIEITLNNKSFKTTELTFTRVDTNTGEVQTVSKYEYEQLTHEEQASFSPVKVETNDTPDYTRLADSEYLLSIFYKYSRGLRVFSRKDNNHKSRCTPIPLLNLGTPKPLIPIITAAANPKYKKQMITTYKTLVRFYYTTKDASYLQIAEKMAKASNEEAELQKQLKKLEPYRAQYQKQQQPGTGLPL
jgi:hypothetical protein